MSPTDVIEAIADKIAELWPDRIIYRTFCPGEHQRPSCFLYLTKAEAKHANIGLVRWEMEADVELFSSTDHYDVSSTEVLRREQMSVLEAFGGPGLAVGDRTVSVQALADGAEAGSAYVRFLFEWTDMRPGYQESDQQKMEHYELHT